MDAFAKLEQLGDFMRFEPAEELRPASRLVSYPGLPDRDCGESLSKGGVCPAPDKTEYFVHQAVMPGGKRIALLKTLLTSACERDCYYCAFRSGRDTPRTTFQPDELAQAFMTLVRARKVEGLFLSSSMAGGGVRTQDRLLDTAEILRFKLGFRGYLHLKIMPGAERAQLERAMQLADRVSINLEAPSTARLAKLAPHKTFFEELLRPLQWADEIRRTQPSQQGWNGRWPSTTTQFVAGGSGESDLELLEVTSRLYQQVHLSRAYFSGFAPIKDTPLENQPPMDPWREHRLYQASFLLRDYGFDLEELPFSNHGDLPIETDPKLAWARSNLCETPVDVNRADPQELLRVPGIGPKGAKAIVSARRQNRLRSLGDLRALGVVASRAAPFVLFDGRRPAQQLALF